MIIACYIDRECLDTPTSGKGRRRRVDAYFVSYLCQADAVNPGGPHEWACRFEVPRGKVFRMQNFTNKDAARSARGFVTD